ncbi:MAG: aminotransferase class I/II-fold pyridoxal phosphate-dependent enzyme [Lachnospiraceae bacterium]|nr:aminotransferase class I/II-fold pyridoxal phosphate-dependent enzyme [Lachnospiraceae bacterium]
MIRELQELSRSDIYPFHMPGHKRNMEGSVLASAYGFDITEIDGFDDLRFPKGLIRAIEKRAEEYYGADRAFLLVNGSTTGNLSAISALVSPGGKLLMGRPCHVSADNAVELRGLKPVYLEPETVDGSGIPGGITPEAVRKALRENEEIEAVFVTSPTYEGVCSDLDGIADAVHEKGIPLIADSAHGAHLKISSKADVVTVSLHKTLPAMTSTSLCLVNGSKVREDEIKKYINMFQTTSPSYILMAGAEECFRMMEEEGESRKKELKQNTERLLDAMKDHRNIRAVGEEIIGKQGVFWHDPTKICLYDPKGRHSGEEIYKRLLAQYRIQPEKAEDRICLLIASLMDTREGFDRLIAAVRGTEQEWARE